MTGNEALEDLYYSNLDAFIDIEETNEQVEIIKKELKLLAKYKRAFEILKPFIKVHQWLGKDVYELDIEYVSRKISQEKYELLEELLND